MEDGLLDAEDVQQGASVTSVAVVVAAVVVQVVRYH